MDIQKTHDEALERLREFINHNVTKAKKEHAKAAKATFGRIMPARNYGVTIYNREEFYALVNWLNKRIGKGGHFWTVSQPVLKYIDPSKKKYNPPKVCNWTVFKPWVDVSDAPTLMGEPIIYP